MESKDSLILANLPLVARIARSMLRRAPKHASADDLISAGNLGLVDCARRFDGERDFETYASFRVKGAILDYLRGIDLLTRDERQSEKTLERERHDLGENAAPLYPGRRLVPFDPAAHYSVGVSSGEAHLIATLDAERLMKRLTPRQRSVIQLRYFEDLTNHEIGELLGVNESRASQLIGVALAAMRK